MTEKPKRFLARTGLFAAFMFLQLAALMLGNHAGDALAAERRERVYYGLQVFVILGFFSHAAAASFPRGGSVRVRRVALTAALGLFFVSSAALFLVKTPPASLAAAFLMAASLGHTGGAVYERMSAAAGRGERVALSMGLACAAAVGLQYLLQIAYDLPVPLAAVSALAFAALALLLLAPGASPLPAPRAPGVTENRDRTGLSASEKRPRGFLGYAYPCLIAAALVLLTSFYNGYIHHLQVQTSYTDFNVYSAPRLMFIPCYLLFAAIGDRRQGRYVPTAALCAALAALLTPVLTGSDSPAGWYAAMCLFYFAVGAAVSYYNLTFWRLAALHPALWAPMGRVIDSAVVLFGAAIGLSGFSALLVQILDLIVVAALIVLMALNGDFDFSSPAESPAESPAPADLAPAPHDGGEEERVARIAAEYGLTPKEAEVLRAVLTSDLATGRLGESLGVSPRTMYRHLNSIYDKTGTDSRMALVMKFHR